MTFLLARNWWSLVLRGIAAVLFGVFTFAMPGITLNVLVFVFGIYALLDGIINLAGAWRASHEHKRWGVSLLEGLVGLATAIIAFGWPGITMAVLIYIVAVWAVVTGVLEIAAAIRIRKHVVGEWLLALTGVVSIGFGVALFAAPLIGALVIALWIGAYAFIFGALMIILGVRLRNHHQKSLIVTGPGALTA